MSNKVTGHRRHLAYELVHGRNFSCFAVSLRGFRFATVTQKIGAKLFPHMLLFQCRTERMSKRMRTKSLLRNPSCNQNRFE
jgi:hypothetical protein